MKVVSSSTLGYPRMGPRRELKFALEKYWKKGSTFSEAELLSAARAVEEKAWALQAAKVDKVTVGDHYLYDGILTWTEYLGIFPKRFNSQKPGLERMFAMARGADGSPALSTLKANDANGRAQVFKLAHSYSANPTGRYEEVDHQ